MKRKNKLTKRTRTVHSSSPLKRDTHQLCDRSRDGSIDPVGGRGGEEGREEAEEEEKGVADVAEKLRQVSRRQPDPDRKRVGSVSE